MKLLDQIKAFIQFRKELKKMKQGMRQMIADAEENAKRYVLMTTEELSTLDDEELFEAAQARTEHKVESFDELKVGINALNDAQKVFYCVSWLEMEVNNGGLCQFFVNSSRMAAPLVSEYMGMIGAEEHQKLYDDFVRDNGIDLTDLSAFDIKRADDFEKKAQMYPFDDYDDAFYNMEPLMTFLTSFVRANLAQF